MLTAIEGFVAFFEKLILERPYRASPGADAANDNHETSDDDLRWTSYR